MYKNLIHLPFKFHIKNLSVYLNNVCNALSILEIYVHNICTFIIYSNKLAEGSYIKVPRPSLMSSQLKKA